jgi:VWFA-related protein
MPVNAATIALLLAFPLLAQDDVIFRSNTTLATVTFHVVKDKHYVDDLKPQDLVLLEDGTPRDITLFEGGRSKIRTTAVDIALLFDISGSVVDEGLLDMTVWKNAFLTSLPNASLAVYGFAASLKRFCLPSRDPQQLEAAFNSVLKTSRKGPTVSPVNIMLQLPSKRKSDPRGGTWIYEAVIAAVKDMAAWPGNATHLIVIFSDGFPTTTSVPEDAAKVARDNAVTIYPVALGHWRIVEKEREIAPLLNGNPKPNEGAQRRMDNLRAQEQEIVDFASLGELTGGRSFDPPMMNSDMLRRIIGAMVGSVLTEYVVGFTPEASDHPARHKLAVKLVSKDAGKLMGGTRSIIH